MMALGAQWCHGMMIATGARWYMGSPCPCFQGNKTTTIQRRQYYMMVFVPQQSGYTPGQNQCE